MFLLVNKKKYLRILPVMPSYVEHCNYVALVILHKIYKQAHLFQHLVRLNEKYKFLQANSEH